MLFVIGIGVLQYLQAITPKICVGAELMYQRAPQIPGGGATVLNMCGRYTGTNLYNFYLTINILYAIFSLKLI